MQGYDGDPGVNVRAIGELFTIAKEVLLLCHQRMFLRKVRVLVRACSHPDLAALSNAGERSAHELRTDSYPGWARLYLSEGGLEDSFVYATCWRWNRDEFLGRCAWRVRVNIGTEGKG